MPYLIGLFTAAFLSLSAMLICRMFSLRKTLHVILVCGVLTASETYPTKDACENGIASVKKNAGVPVEDQTREEKQNHPKYELYKDKGGDFRFRLKAANGEIIGKSEGYKAKASAKKGIASIAKNAPDAPVIVLDAEK